MHILFRNIESVRLFKNQTFIYKVLFLNLCLLLLISCTEKKVVRMHNIVTPSALVLPEIPLLIQSPSEKLEFLINNYWENFNFSDTTLINNSQYTEQAFVNYLDYMRHSTLRIATESINKMLNLASASSPKMFQYFIDLYERYLYDPNSPYRQGDYYLQVLKYLKRTNVISSDIKTRYEYQLKMSLKNCPGDIATDFIFSDNKGHVRKLSSIRAKWTLLFFNNPDCHDCMRVKYSLMENPVVNNLVNGAASERLQVVAIYPDEDISLWEKAQYPANWLNGCTQIIRKKELYDLRAIPCLYLLGKDKKVILKDVTVEVLLDYLARCN